MSCQGARILQFKGRKNLDKIIGLIPFKDKDGNRYIPFCDLPKHMGYVKYPGKCMRNHCKHYAMLYIDEHCYLDEYVKNFKKDKKGPETPYGKGC